MSSQAKCYRQHCDVPIAFPVEMAGEMFECPIAKWIPALYSAASTTRPAKTEHPKSSQKSSVHSAQLREGPEKIRARTCYQSLRSLINLAQIIGFVGIGIFAFSLVTGISRSAFASSGSSEFALVGSLFACEQLSLLASAPR
jgi:hypothetical protein